MNGRLFLRSNFLVQAKNYQYYLSDVIYLGMGVAAMCGVNNKSDCNNGTVRNRVAADLARNRRPPRRVTANSSLISKSQK